MKASAIVDYDSPILITGSTGFIGIKVVDNLLRRGFRRLRCLARPTTSVVAIESLAKAHPGASVEILRGNLQSRGDCLAAAKDATVVYHLAAGRGEKSFPDAFMNSVVTTRNLLDGLLGDGHLRRFVNVSSFAVYSNRNKPKGRLLDETCPEETNPEIRGEAYCFAKVKQDELVREYGRNYGLPFVIVRPGYVFGPGKQAISGRICIDSFGPLLHLGGSNSIPFTFIDNCADAIVLAGLQLDVDGEVFNVVDDDLPSSRQFLRGYKRRVKPVRSFYVPGFVSYGFCYFWQRYSKWSKGQLLPVYNVSRWHANWKKTTYSNAKIKSRLNWAPKVPMADALSQFFESCKPGGNHA